MNKRSINLIVFVLWLSILTYIGIAFYYGDLNASHWDQVLRNRVLFGWGVAIVIYMIFE